MKTTHTPRDSLLDWFDRHQRDLPWRRTRDPYAIWVSEIMLQQTRVETARPYFERFMDRYPSLQSLAAAEIEEVLGLWSGLGYYRRARRLHRAARHVVDSGGQIPADLAGLQDLPGVGTYTAAAIGSMAFGLVEPAVDGNVERVLSRYLGVAGDPKRGEARKQIVAGARLLLDEQRPGDSNQALMELGASLCRPQGPLCTDCPLEAGCYATENGNPEAFPSARPRRAPTRVERQLAVVECDGRILLFRRPDSSELLAGLWELPWVEVGGAPGRERPFENRYGGSWQLGEALGRVKHSITHRVFDVRVLAARWASEGEIAESREAGWFTPREIESLPTSSLVTKALTLAYPGSAGFAGGE